MSTTERAPNPFAYAGWTQSPASHEEAWGAYERLVPELRRLAAARLAGLRPTPLALVRAPAELAAFARAIPLPAAASPRVSIVVPGLDGAREVLECLASVAAAARAPEYEVLVVVDPSDGESGALLPLVPNLRLLRGAERRDAVGACHRGAQAARGEYLVFLSAGARPTPGWLEPLLETFTAFERVGAVGPKLVDPDGRLVAAGARVRPDLSVAAIGAGDDPSRARWSEAREVQCCPGDCLAVERRRFEEAGGFDPALAPRAYEDLDLQLRLRRRGLRSVCQPASVVVLRGGLSGAAGSAAAAPGRAIVRSAQRMRERWGDLVDAMDAVRLVAFYLPQFHPIPENDLWWGKGFTEWANVAKARPSFVGHEQPHLPAELGFYDLRVPEVLDEQARLARAHGISAFCFYYYWFQGRRLLEAPVERLLQSRRAPIPFCLCWANEDWTRAWDGLPGGSDVLVGQAHSDADDEAVILDLARYLRHPSYLRVNGKPALLVYRVGLFPDVRRTAALWRERCRREGIGELHLVRVDSFENAPATVPPAEHGFDAAVEFPPLHRQAPIARPLELLDDAFAGSVQDYEAIVLQSIAYKEARGLHYRCVMPRWDNTPRRQGAATVFAGSTPGAYQAWLEEALRYTRDQNVGDERLLFVNAWNEWAEGAHLEPDRRYGRGYLEATRNAVAAHLLGEG